MVYTADNKKSVDNWPPTMGCPYITHQIHSNLHTGTY